MCRIMQTCFQEVKLSDFGCSAHCKLETSGWLPKLHEEHCAKLAGYDALLRRLPCLESYVQDTKENSARWDQTCMDHTKFQKEHLVKAAGHDVLVWVDVDPDMTLLPEHRK